MPILRVNAGPDDLALNGSLACVRSTIMAAAAGTGPVMILIHGFKYDPTCAARSPHTSIFGTAEHAVRARKAHWLRPLGFGRGHPNEGLAIAFAWPAHASLWQAARAATVAGRQMGDMIASIHRRAPLRPIHVISHSMGSEVVFEALSRLPKGAVSRIITLSGASYASRAMAALGTPAGQGAELFNITSRENDVFDFMFERLMPAPRRDDWAMGRGVDAPNAVNIQLDCACSLAALAQFGGYIAPPRGRMSHWSSYMRPGVLRFYGRVLRDPGMVPLAALQQRLPALGAPRWSRLFARPHASGALLAAHPSTS